MRAIEFHGAEQLEIVERPDPAPGEGELLIAPTGVGICGTDIEVFDGSLAYFRDGDRRVPDRARPRVDGHGGRRRRRA